MSASTSPPTSRGTDPNDAPHDRPRRYTRLRLAGGVACVCLLGLLALLSISFGAKPIPVSEVWGYLFAPTGGYDSDVVHSVRLPRTVAGVVVGAALGLAGALMQALTRNPLADPGILGVNAGAFGGVVLAVGLLGITAPGGYVWFALLGAAGASLVVYLLGSGGRSSATPVRLALAGTAVGVALTALTSTVIVTNQEAFDRVRLWNLGSLAVQDASTVSDVLPLVVVGCVIGLVMAPPLNALALGEELSRALGARIARTRVLTAVAIILLCGSATAITGPIGFVGLMVPHAVRSLTGPDQRLVLPFSMGYAAVLLLTADLFGRLVAWPGELEVGIVTAVIGGPVLILLVRRRGLAQL